MLLDARYLMCFVYECVCVYNNKNVSAARDPPLSGENIRRSFSHIHTRSTLLFSRSAVSPLFYRTRNRRKEANKILALKKSSEVNKKTTGKKSMDTTTASGGGGSGAARIRDHQVDGVYDGCAQINVRNKYKCI